MADTKITDLTSATAAVGDELVINDITDTSDKKVTAGSIVDTITGNITVNSLGVSALAANVVDSSELVDGGIDLSHMSVNSIDSDQYVDASIDLAHMSVNSIDSDQYVDGSIDAAHMSANSIDSDSYVDASIDLAHMSVNSIDSDQYIDASIDLAHLVAAAKEETFSFAISDNTTALTTGTKFTWYTPYAITLTDIQASVLTAPTDATLIIDVHEAGTTIMTTDKLDIETAEFHTNTAATQPTITDTALAAGAKIEFIIDQIGSSVAGAGAVVYLVGHQT